MLCCVVLVKVKGSTLPLRKSASHEPVTMRVRVLGHPELEIWLGFCGLFVVSRSAGIGFFVLAGRCRVAMRK